MDEYINTDQLYWFLTRSAGIMTWIAACTSVVIGLLMSSKMFGKRPGQPWLLDFHRYLSAMSIVFLVIHMFTIWADDFVEFGAPELFVPGTNTEELGYSTISITLGVLAAWFLVLIQVTSLLKDYIPNRIWHGIHLTSIAVVLMGVVHGYQAGTEKRNILVLAVAASMLAAILLGFVARILGGRQATKYKEYRAEVLENTKQQLAVSKSDATGRRRGQQKAQTLTQDRTLGGPTPQVQPSHADAAPGLPAQPNTRSSSPGQRPRPKHNIQTAQMDSRYDREPKGRGGGFGPPGRGEVSGRGEAPFVEPGRSGGFGAPGRLEAPSHRQRPVEQQFPPESQEEWPEPPPAPAPERW